MRIKKCYVCGRPAFPPSTENKKWICPACEKKINEMDYKNPVNKPDYCHKCRKRTADTCPFTPSERSKIVRCNHWVGRDTEHNKRRFNKFENNED